MEKMPPEKKQTLIKWIFITVGLLFIMDTVILLLRNNWNLGIVLPAILGAPLLVYGVFKPKLDAWFRRDFGKFVKWLFICGYLFLAAIILVFSGMMLRAANTRPAPGADAAIVLGAGVRGDVPSLTLQSRLDKAVEYWRENPDTVILGSGGMGAGAKYSEAYVMKQYLMDQGVPENKILVEDRSTSTAENFRYSKEMLDETLGGDYRVVFVSNDYHILRAGMNAQAAGFSRAGGLAARTPAFIAPNSFAREALALLSAYVFGVEN